MREVALLRLSDLDAAKRSKSMTEATILAQTVSATSLPDPMDHLEYGKTANAQVRPPMAAWRPLSHRAR